MHAFGLNFTWLASQDSGLFSFVILGLVIVLLGSILQYFKQPYVIAYILAGVLLGEHCFALITDEGLITSMGEFGLILLLFFIGMEINLPDLLKNWKIATYGTIYQIIGCVLLTSLIGFVFDWPINRIIVIGFVISLSSSAVIIKLLQDTNESQSSIGQHVISILLMQDILIVPMIIITNYLGGNSPDFQAVLLQIIGGIIIIGGMIWVMRNKDFSLPFSNRFEDDHEMQVFVAFFMCFGFALVTALFGLSAALGAFVGGMIVRAARSTEWFHDSLHSFRVVFVAIFFVSIGMLIDLGFLLGHWQMIGTVLLAVYIGNQVINTLVFRYFGSSKAESLYGGALLAQIGELSFLLISTAFTAHIISDYAYQLTIIVISLTLLLSPFWIAFVKRFLVK